MEAVTKDGSLVEEYAYDSLPYGTCTWQMDDLRGITGRTLEYNDEDHLLSTGATDYQYDLDGFLESKTSGNETTYYDYTSRGELLRVDLPEAPPSNTSTIPLAAASPKRSTAPSPRNISGRAAPACWLFMTVPTTSSCGSSMPTAACPLQ
ncbi:MAG: hypothetical protein SWH61_07655 [Thermodesulfobacteriota bacterium]|nr:hypothetical protein [Thermodesulfobacteriota bacterium]